MKIVLTDLIKEQGMQCLIMLGAGLAVGIFYQVCALISRRTRMNKWVRMAAEPVFWLIAAVLFSQFLYYCAYGRLSVHTIAAFGAGVLLWIKFFCGIIIPDNDKQTGIRGLKKKNGKEKKKQSV